MALDRNQMLARLKAMPPAEFEELIFNARIRDIIPRNEPQLVRAIAVIEYFEGPGPHQTWTTLESLVENPPTSLHPAPCTPSPTSPTSPTPPTPLISTSHLPSPVPNFVGRNDELNQLNEAWHTPTTNVFTIVAFGGVGKSALVAEWLQRLSRDQWRGAEVVLGHSFYSQGSRDDAQVSAEPFIASALQFFGDPNPEAGSAWEKGERLARLIRQRRTLLVLDGLEPLQWGASSYEVGCIKDQGLTALVRELAYDNPGLCLITTRQPIADIPTSPQLDLNHLSEKAGAALLQLLGVQGLTEELQAASRQVNGHGLALRLLGTYLKKAHNGDVRRIGEIQLAQVDQRLGGKAFHLVAKYERWLGEGPELSILRLLGLFDRPAEPDCIAALCTAPAIPGLTDALVNLTPADWNFFTNTLIDYGLLSPDTQPDTRYPIPDTRHPLPSPLNAHPLIREYFATHLATHHPDATREAHGRLYAHLKQAAPELPETLQEMMPLYHSISHGGKAGLWQEALDDVLYARISRQGENFSASKLGAMGTDLAALSTFFDAPFVRPTSNLTEAAQALVLNKASFRLQALGRLTEATQPMQAALEYAIANSIFQKAALQASNLSELYLILGNVAAAVRVAEQSIELADRSGDGFQRMARRTKVAEALHQAGRLSASWTAFREAEALQAEDQPQYPQLYSIGGFQYCDLLLEPGLRSGAASTIGADEAAVAGDEGEPSARLEQCQEVRERAEYGLDLSTRFLGKGLGLLDIGLDHLTLGRTWLLEATLHSQSTNGDAAKTQLSTSPTSPNPPTSPNSPAHPTLREAAIASTTHPPAHPSTLLQTATHHLNHSVSLLRQAGAQHRIPLGLLARAALRRTQAEFKTQNSKLDTQNSLTLAHRDLTEVEQIAGRSGMLPFLVDAALERCRLALVQGNIPQAREKLAEAKALVKRTQAPYEPHVPDWAEWQPPETIGVLQPGEVVGYYRRNGELGELERRLS
jgi:tetratricopeptide (TPR) repeat protein